MPRKGVPEKFHGKAGRSGRKPKAFTLLKRQLEQDGKDDAQYAYSLFVTVLKDDTADIELRLDCAREVMNRVLGKPKESVEHSGQIGIKSYKVVSPDDWDDSKPAP